MNVSFTSKQERYIADQVGSGDFQNASEVVRDALRLHEQYRRHIIGELKKAIKEGDESADSDRNIKDILMSRENG